MKTEVAVLRALLSLSRRSGAVTVADLTRYVRETDREVETALVALAREGLVVRRADATSLSFGGLAVAVAAAARAKDEAKNKRSKPFASIHALPRRVRAA